MGGKERGKVLEFAKSARCEIVATPRQLFHVGKCRDTFFSPSSFLPQRMGERRPKPCRLPVPPPRSFERPSKRDLKFSLNQPRGKGNSRIAEWEEEGGCKQNGRVSEFDPSQRCLFSC